MKTKLITTLTMAVALALPASRAIADTSDAGAIDATAEVVSIDATSSADAAASPVSAATEVVPPSIDDKNALDLATKVVKDVSAGDWRYATSGLLFLLMLGLARFRDKLSWFKGDRGGAILVGILGFGGGVATWLASESALDWRLFAGSMATVWTSVGGYTWIKRLIWPKD